MSCYYGPVGKGSSVVDDNFFKASWGAQKTKSDGMVDLWQTLSGQSVDWTSYCSIFVIHS